MAAVVLVGGDGPVRVGERNRSRGGERPRVWEREVWGVCGIVQRSRGSGGKQEVAHGGARASGTRPSSWKEEDDRGGARRAGPRRWAGQLGRDR